MEQGKNRFKVDRKLGTVEILKTAKGGGKWVHYKKISELSTDEKEKADVFWIYNFPKKNSSL